MEGVHRRLYPEEPEHHQTDLIKNLETENC